MQFTDIINLGKSWEIYCKKHGVQSGGAGMASDLFGNIENTDTGPKTPKQKRRADRKRGKSAPAPAPAAAAAPAATAPAGPSAKTIKAADKAASGSGKKGLFSKAKSGLSKTVSSSPVFGNLSNIFDALGNTFYVMGIILVIVGVVSLPVLMFLVVLYSVIKNLFGRFSKL